MSALEIFSFQNAEIRAALIDGEPWLVAQDVCAVLELANPRSSLALLDDDEKGVHTMDTRGGPQRMRMVNQSGALSLVLRSRRPEAKAFKRWLTKEVLPAIFKTGQYTVPARRAASLPSRRELALMVVEAEDALAASEQRVAELEPRAHFAEEFLAAKGDYSVRQAAHLLDRDSAIDTGRTRLFEYLRGIPWISKDRTPIKRWVDAGFIASGVSKSWRHPKTGVRMAGGLQPRVTTKGMYELHRMLGGADPLVLEAPDDADDMEDALFSVEGGAA